MRASLPVRRPIPSSTPDTCNLPMGLKHSSNSDSEFACLELLTDEFFERLERDGKYPWTSGARARLQQLIERYVRLTRVLPDDCKPRHRATQKVRDKAKLVREALEEHPHRDRLGKVFRASYGTVEKHFASDVQRLLGALQVLIEQPAGQGLEHNEHARVFRRRLPHLQKAIAEHPDDYLVDLAFTVAFGLDEEQTATDGERMLEGLRALEKLGRIGLPKRPALKLLISEVARIYCAMGGKATLSRDGPFACVLELLHEIIPVTGGFAKTCGGLVDFAEKHRREIQDHVRRYPLMVSDLALDLKKSAELE